MGGNPAAVSHVSRPVLLSSLGSKAAQRTRGEGVLLRRGGGVGRPW